MVGSERINCPRPGTNVNANQVRDASVCLFLGDRRYRANWSMRVRADGNRQLAKSEPDRAVVYQYKSSQALRPKEPQREMSTVANRAMRSLSRVRRDSQDYSS